MQIDDPHNIEGSLVTIKAYYSSGKEIDGTGLLIAIDDECSNDRDSDTPDLSDNDNKLTDAGKSRQYMLLTNRYICFLKDIACNSFSIHHRNGVSHYTMNADTIKKIKFSLHYLMCVRIGLEDGTQHACLPRSVLRDRQVRDNEQLFVSGYFKACSDQLHRCSANKISATQAVQFSTDPVRWQHRQIRIVNDHEEQHDYYYGQQQQGQHYYAGCVIWNDSGPVGMIVGKVGSKDNLVYASIDDILSIL